MYKMLRSFQLENFDGTFEDMVNLYLEGKMWYGPWWEHVDQFVNWPNIYCVHYETIMQVKLEKKKTSLTLYSAAKAQIHTFSREFS
jgi:hypothetical protein